LRRMEGGTRYGQGMRCQQAGLSTRHPRASHTITMPHRAKPNGHGHRSKLQSQSPSSLPHPRATPKTSLQPSLPHRSRGICSRISTTSSSQSRAKGSEAWDSAEQRRASPQRRRRRRPQTGSASFAVKSSALSSRLRSMRRRALGDGRRRRRRRRRRRSVAGVGIGDGEAVRM